MHLLLASGEDTFDPQSWSGTAFSMREALGRHVDRLSVFRPPAPVRTPLTVALRVLLGAKRYPLWATRATLRANARALRAAIERDRPDAVLSISSTCLAELGEPPVPTFLCSDAPFEAYQTAYRGTVDRPLTMARFERQEAAVARTLDGLCFASGWACAEALRLFGPGGRGGTPLKERLHVTEMGANWVPSLDREQLLERVAGRDPGRLDFLFLGRDWERKGGPLAVEVVRLLREQGHAATLHVVGCRPPVALDSVRIHGPLFRSDPREAAQLAELFLDCHFLLVPTSAECFGLSFAEAQAFALPPISRAVHALPSVVLDGKTGLLLDPAAAAPAYVERILALLAEPEAYRAMAVAARDRFEQLLNWDAMAAELVRVIEAGIVRRGREVTDL